MPAPMITPMPKTVRSRAVRLRLSLNSGSWVSLIDCSTDLVRKTSIPGNLAGTGSGCPGSDRQSVVSADSPQRGDVPAVGAAAAADDAKVRQPVAQSRRRRSPARPGRPRRAPAARRARRGTSGRRWGAGLRPAEPGSVVSVRAVERRRDGGVGAVDDVVVGCRGRVDARDRVTQRSPVGQPAVGLYREADRGRRAGRGPRGRSRSPLRAGHA